MRKLTTAEAKLICLQKGYELVGEYAGSAASHSFVCSKGHVFTARYNMVATDRWRCKICTNTSMALGLPEVEQDAKAVGLTYVRGFVNTKLNCVYLCPAHGEVEMSPTAVRSQRSGCRFCCKHGFIIGKPAYLYLGSVDNLLKVGITNDLGLRVTQHEKTCQRLGKTFSLLQSFYFEQGSKAATLEKAIKSTFQMASGLDGNGFKTELMPLSQLGNVLKLVENGI